MIEQLRKRVYGLLEGSVESAAARWVRLSIQALIVLNVSAVVAQTVDFLGQEYAGEFRAFEILSIAIFSVEYLSRIWSVTVNPAYAHWLKGRLRFAIVGSSPTALIGEAG